MADGWHLDKKVPITLILTLLIQTASFVWWAATMDQRVEFLERALTQSETQVVSLTDKDSNTTTAIAVLQEQVNTITVNQNKYAGQIESLQRTSARIEAKLDILVDDQN